MRSAALRSDFETTHLRPAEGELTFSEQVRALLEQLTAEEWRVVGKRLGFLHSLEETRALFGSAEPWRERRPDIEEAFVAQMKRECGL